MRTWIFILLTATLCNGAELISRVPRASQTAAGASSAPIISADSRYIAFLSSANNLATNDSGRDLDLFLHDLQNGTTRLISAGAGNSAYASFSGDGQLLAYAREIDGVNHVFLYDQATGSSADLTAAALASPNGPPPTGSSRPLITTDGRWVLFESTATNLISEADTNGLPDLFVRDLTSGSNLLVYAGAVPRPGSYLRQSFQAAISAHGEVVAFVSRNVPAPTTNVAVRSDVLVRDMVRGDMIWASTNVENIIGSSSAEYVCSHPILNGEGNVVVFKVAASRSSTNGLVLRHNLQTAETIVIASNSVPQMPPALSSDGRFVGCDSSGQIFRYDGQSGSNELVTISADGTSLASGVSLLTSLTPDGHVVAFLSSATNLTGAGNASASWQAYTRDLRTEFTRLISVNTNGQPALQSFFGACPQLDAAGTRVVFDYTGSDLMADDFNDAADVFVCDLAEGAPTAISRAMADLPSLTTARGLGAEMNSITSDGTKVTFTAYDIASIASDTNLQRDVFVADLSTGNVSLASKGDIPSDMRASDGVLSGNGRFALYFRELNAQIISGSLRLFRRDLTSGLSEEVDPAAEFRSVYLDVRRTFHPAVSDDGDVVVYSKSGLLYLKDMLAGTNQLIAQSRFALSGGREMINPKLTPDLRRVTFQHSYPADITTNQFRDTGFQQFNLFARDLQGTAVILISADEQGYGLGTAAAKGMSSDGRYVAYDVWVALPRLTNIYMFDFVTRANTLICSNCSDPSLSADGRFVAYAGLRPGSTFPLLINDIYVKDRASGTVARIGDNVANDGSSRPLLSADGRYVVFTSKASNYVANDDNGAQDVFLHDRYRGVTYRLSAGSGPSARHIISRDGRTVVFQSLAGDLTPGDYNEALDIFSVRLGAGDSDKDGMDDAWELTYFNNLDRDGSADFDSDGHSDFQEFLAGTDPTNAGSVLEVIAIRSLNPSQVRVLWTATVGKHYVIQSKTSLGAPEWANATEPITANDAFMSFDFASASPNAFYRVVLVQ